MTGEAGLSELKLCEARCSLRLNWTVPLVLRLWEPGFEPRSISSWTERARLPVLEQDWVKFGWIDLIQTLKVQSICVGLCHRDILKAICQCSLAISPCSPQKQLTLPSHIRPVYTWKGQENPSWAFVSWALIPQDWPEAGKTDQNPLAVLEVERLQGAGSGS